MLNRNPRLAPSTSRTDPKITQQNCRKSDPRNWQSQNAKTFPSTSSFKRPQPATKISETLQKNLSSPFAVTLMQVRKLYLNSNFYKFISLKLSIFLQEQSQENKNSKPTKTTVHASESKIERKLLS